MMVVEILILENLEVVQAGFKAVQVLVKHDSGRAAFQQLKVVDFAEQVVQFHYGVAHIKEAEAASRELPAIVALRWPTMRPSGVLAAALLLLLSAPCSACSASNCGVCRC